MSDADIPRPIPSGRSRSLLGRTTVLILSSYLIGISSSHHVVKGLENYILLVGVCGVIGYFGFEFVARRREQRAHQEADEQAALKLQRLTERERHNRLEPRMANKPESLRGAVSVADLQS